MAMLGGVDSVARPGSGQNFGAARDHGVWHLPRVAPALAKRSLQAGSVVLKNETG